jgi:hypothetical protein
MVEAKLKLCIELIPDSCWYRNLRKQIKQSKWDRLRKQVYADQGNVCRICGGAGRLNCHENWSYDDDRHIQRLLGFHAVCGMCHHAEHFGVSQILAAQGHLDLEAVIEHFMKVNGVGRKEFAAHKTDAFRVWRQRSKHQWQVDLGEWAPLVGEIAKIVCE